MKIRLTLMLLLSCLYWYLYTLECAATTTEYGFLLGSACEDRKFGLELWTLIAITVVFGSTIRTFQKETNRL